MGSRREHIPRFDLNGFYAAVAQVVQTRGVTWRRVASDTGITQSSLTRLGQGHDIQGAALATLAAWASVNPADFVRQSGQNTPIPLISKLLEADDRLTTSARQALLNTIRAAYESLASAEASPGSGAPREAIDTSTGATEAARSAKGGRLGERRKVA